MALFLPSKWLQGGAPPVKSWFTIPLSIVICTISPGYWSYKPTWLSWGHHLVGHACHWVERANRHRCLNQSQSHSVSTSCWKNTNIFSTPDPNINHPGIEYHKSLDFLLDIYTNHQNHSKSMMHIKAGLSHLYHLWNILGRVDKRGKVTGGADLASTAFYPEKFCAAIFRLWSAIPPQAY